MDRNSDAPPPSRVPIPSERLLGTIVSERYQLRRELGRGGIAAVFVADHVYTGRTHALKLLLPHLTHDPEARSRLLHEAGMLARVKHPNVVEVIDAGPSDRGPYVVMERLRGRSLESLVAARGVLTVSDAMYVGRKACDALLGVHTAGLVHRDVKPGNLFVVKEADGKKSLKLIDLGAACNIGTAEDTIIGTPEYIAPEILKNEAATPASDVYALGVTLYECLAGVVPYPGSLREVLARMASPPPDLRRGRPDVPRGVALVVARAITADPRQRFQSGADFKAALAEAEATEEDVSVDETAPVSTMVTREHLRAPFHAPVELQFGDSALEATAEDISIRGLLVMATHALPVGTIITVRFPLPQTGTIVMYPARVRWARPRHRGKCAMGIEITELPESGRKVIDAYVTETGATPS
jgi:serine/threonine-protein kinase